MNRVVLTFDNGPELGVTGEVLDILGRYGVRATFFVIGTKLRQPGVRRLAERAREEGHRVGNHTLTHTVPLGRMNASESRDEIAKTQELLGDLAPEKLFRPYGEGGLIGPHILSPAARDYLIEKRFTCVLWNAVPRDWEDVDGWVETAMEMYRQTPHSLVVLHDLPTGAMRHLPAFLDRLVGSGAEFTQDFPEECLPIVNGLAKPDSDRFVTLPNC